MKKLICTIVLVSGYLSAQAGVYAFHSGHGWRGGWHGRDRVSFSIGVGYPWYYGSAYSYPYYSYYYSPGYYAYSYSPAYVYPEYPAYGYSYSRPNYAVGGTLLGALTGGLIGNSIHHQGWEGAGIGAAAGLVLGSIAEHSARVQERNYYSTASAYAQPSRTIADAPTVNPAPAVADPPPVGNSPTVYRPASAMSGANSLFGR